MYQPTQTVKPKTFHLIASGFGIGYIPLAPKLWASVLAFIISTLIKQYTNHPEQLCLTLIVTFAFIGSYCIKQVKLTKTAPTWIVLDEMIGTWLALLLMPQNLVVCIFAFCTFQIINLFKPLILKNSYKYKNLEIVHSVLVGLISNSLVYFILNIIYSVKE